MAEKSARPSFWDCIHPEALRKPRRLEEGWSYSPAWRYELVQEYVVEKDMHSAMGQSYMPPEQDPWLMDLYCLGALGACNNPASRWCLDLVRSNPYRFGLSRLKALIISGMPKNRICRYMHITDNELKTAMKLFFDVEDYLTDTNFISSIVFGAQTDSPASMAPWQAREQAWMTAAFLLKERGLMMFLERALNYDAAEISKMQDIIYKALVSASMEYAVSLRGNGTARPCDFDRLMQYQQSQSIVQANLQNKTVDASDFAKALLGILPKKGGAVSTMAEAMTGAIEVPADIVRLPNKGIEIVSSEDYFGNKKTMQPSANTITFPHSL